MEPTMTPFAEPDDPHALELRVLEGPQAGASAPLPEGMGCVIAAAPAGDGADVWLRDDSAPPARVRVVAAQPHGAIEVLDGAVRLGERALEIGVPVAWAMHQPLVIGRSVVAFGLAQQPSWPEAGAPAAAAAPAHAPKRSRAGVWLATLAAGIAMAGAGALVLARVSAATGDEAVAPATPTLEGSLRNSEFATLAVAREPAGGLRLTGRLATQAQRARLDAWLAARDFAARVEVQVDEQLARDVTDVFRVNGVPVQARVTAPGQVVAEAAEPNADRLARAADVVRRDVRGLQTLAVQNHAKPAPPPAPPVPDDPGKRIASLVPGELGYLVTADGARYFVGSLLPSGHRVTAIAAQHVTLERDGHASTLNF